MIGTFEFSIFLVKNPLPKKIKKKCGMHNYIGFIIDNEDKLNFHSNYHIYSISEAANKVGDVVFCLTDLFQLYITTDYDKGFNIDPGDYTDDGSFKKVKLEFEKYCSLHSNDIDGAIDYIEPYIGKEEYRRIDISTTINNEGVEHFLTKRYDIVLRLNCVNTGSNTIPKFRNKRCRNTRKAYNLLYKNLFK